MRDDVIDWERAERRQRQCADCPTCENRWTVRALAANGGRCPACAKRAGEDLAERIERLQGIVARVA